MSFHVHPVHGAVRGLAARYARSTSVLIETAQSG